MVDKGVQVAYNGNMTNTRWSPEEIGFMKQWYPLKGNAFVSESLGRSKQSVKKMAYRLGLGVVDEVWMELQLKNAARLHETDITGNKNPFWKGGTSKNWYAYKLRSIAKYPERNAARLVMAKAIRRGLLERMPCEICGNPKSEGHHSDYSKPLEVNWLCRKCHIAEHKRLDDSSRT